MSGTTALAQFSTDSCKLTQPECFSICIPWLLFLSGIAFGGSVAPVWFYWALPTIL
jgi:hypothetical protein